MIFFLMRRRPPRSTRTDTLFPYTTLFRSACVSCHNLAEGGDDGLPLPGRAEGRSGEVNTPTIFNSVLSYRLGWRGTYRRLAEQVDADIEDPRLMNTSWPEVIGKLRADPGHLAAIDRKSTRLTSNH